MRTSSLRQCWKAWNRYMAEAKFINKVECIYIAVASKLGSYYVNGRFVQCGKYAVTCRRLMTSRSSEMLERINRVKAGQAMRTWQHFHCRIKISRRASHQLKRRRITSILCRWSDRAVQLKLERNSSGVSWVMDRSAEAPLYSDDSKNYQALGNLMISKSFCTWYHLWQIDKHLKNVRASTASQGSASILHRAWLRWSRAYV